MFTFQRQLAFTALAVVFTCASAAPIPITVRVLDPAGEGFNDPVLGPARQTAFRYAADLWGSFFETSFPGQVADIGIEFNAPVAGNFAAFSTALYGRPSRSSVFQTTALHAENLFRRDLTGTRLHGTVTFNPAIDFFLGTSGRPGPNQADLVTFGLHELGHIFGITSALTASGEYGKTVPGLPGYYDFFTTDASCNQLVDMTPQQRITLATTPGALFWCGENGVAANGGQPFNLAAASPFDPDVHVGHISGTFFPGDVLMDPRSNFLGTAIHRLHPVERGMFADLEWSLAPLQVETVPEPATLMLVLAGLAMSLLRTFTRSVCVLHDLAISALTPAKGREKDQQRARGAEGFRSS
jgi:hypothetical protein